MLYLSRTQAGRGESETLGTFFRFSERGTNLRTEVIAGLTTFMTMAYIVFVSPAILGTEGTGLPITGVFFATCVAASAASIAMGVFANYPLALASGLGINAIVAFTLILELGLSWQQAMAVIVIEGLLVTVLVLTNLREAVMNAIPMSLKLTIALVARGVRGGILIGIVLTGAVGMVFGIVPLPGGVVDFRFDTSTIGGGVLAI